MANPPPPESIRPPLPSVEVDPGQVTIGKGKWAMSMPSVVALAVITSVGGFFTAWLNKPAPGDASEIAKAVRDEMATQKADANKQIELLVKRADGGETKTDLLQGAVNSLIQLRLGERLNGIENKVDRLQQSQDALRDRVNDRLAK